MNDAPLSSAKTKNDWNSISSSPTSLQGTWRNNFTLYQYFIKYFEIRYGILHFLIVSDFNETFIAKYITTISVNTALNTFIHM